jgi:membrane protein required for colicin V production
MIPLLTSIRPEDGRLRGGDALLEVAIFAISNRFVDQQPGIHRQRSAMNSFDAAIYLGLVLAVVTGFNAGLLRSAATILAYLLAMPIAVWAMSMLSPRIGDQPVFAVPLNSLLCFGIFLVAGIVLGKLMRMAIDETVGSGAGIGDRLAGAVLGAVRVGLVAVTLVLVFDQLIPPDRQPKFLNGSQLRPLLSAAGQSGFRSLPPEVAATIDRLKKDRRI